ncbi:MAG: hypothetical protein NZ700_09755 [Gemmataceae bacterium]|nr:hypothetical protein [Gemmataceae bacterium]MDW8266906.1 hypothetical protein [Gemmataceae bacterium]
MSQSDESPVALPPSEGGPASKPSILLPESATPATQGSNLPDRRADVDAKHERVAAMLRAVGCERLLVLEPENFAWLTSGAGFPGILSPAETPALWYSPDERWLLASNIDSQRLFDEELSGLGFQLKEWSWVQGREPLLQRLCRGQSVASDREGWPGPSMREELRQLRRVQTLYERACYANLGEIVSHVLEATCRSLAPKETERDVAGQIGHRLLRRGAEPVAIMVAADGRSRRYRRGGFTTASIQQYCLLQVTARKYGLYVTASRAVSFGLPDPAFRQEFDAACRISATYIASTWPDAGPREILLAGQRIYQVCGYEHDWRLALPGYVTGRAAVESSLTPAVTELLQAGWAVTWQASVGAALSSDTVLVSAKGPMLLTPAKGWPLKRIRVSGANLDRPDILQR